jgi:hypothetical protein
MCPAAVGPPVDLASNINQSHRQEKKCFWGRARPAREAGRSPSMNRLARQGAMLNI